MRLVARVRFEIARRRWIRWLVVAALALLAGRAVYASTSQLDRARSEWGTRRTVLVATVAHRPGDDVRADRRELPVVAVPDGAIDRVPDGAVARRHLAPGEVVLAADLAGHDRPGSLAGPGEVVVGLPSRTGGCPLPGSSVLVVAEGVVLVERGTVVGADAHSCEVAVEESSAPAVAEAARRDTAALAVVP